ncbi:GBS Bsp-like repeat-containing protein [Thomasclavelia ramosa]|uniref:GBS Bsp-like repeat-containing protein n=4 Tax=Coprobacillaceae TaxID=2810280 RepID=UPI001D02A82C|nr:GBS Bsp-like repeat-containing protein [Thomasclavelia ramosa]MCB5401596.1 GBS Bsp-like repeat-containing protein [Thomasclavelia ramosa]MCB5508871.1 GBS Bsp-like repeat-containing protein [Thomasclavelia ramosa]MCB5512922.1 GBS Bsp-like repeat-containing protein [Thomasclavelia ramosa]MCB5519907.1 GBS Bsp-like repeat-containing protein [Thomasclavelia ramosa]MCB5531433.1 GBS Bsp-like repeat-containing protein [Thomasclavelia ramosa]
MKKKIAKVSAASLITLSMTVGNVAAFNNHDDLSVEDESSNDKNIDLNSNSTTELENNSSIETKNGNKEVIGQTKFVDENGNITTVDVYDGTTGEVYNPRLRVVSTANMVNFNCSSAGTTTEFVDYYTGQAGYISKASAADAAFLGYENGKVKFMISGVTGLVDPSKVEVLTQGTYYASNYEVNSSGNLYHYISNNVNATGNQGNSNYVGKGPSYLTKGKEYYSYDGHYFYENYNTMITDYKNNVRTNSVNPSTPYYNYFQYLPMRSKTNYTAQELTTYLNNKANSSTSKLNNTGDMFIKYQNKYGVNALMAASFAALESGWGKSSIAQNKNNLFGMNATDANPSEDAKKYSSVEACIEDFASNWMSKKYLNGTYTSLFRGGYFGDKGSGIFGKYSSDPYEGEKCASIAENMDASISGKDKNYYTIGVKDVAGTSRTNLNVRQSSNISSTVLYTTIKNPSYAFIVRKKTPENEFYEIQSDSVLNSNRTAVSTSAEYNYDSDYAYVSSNHLTIVNNGNDISYEKNEAPVISNAKITNVSRSGYTVTCTVTDDNAVDRVLMPTWSENNGQDDLIWYTANRTGNTYTIEVKTSNHKNDSGKYHTDIYAYDSEGKVSKIELTATVPGANEAPVISNAKITNVSRSGYTVTCTVTDDNAVDRVLMPTWSENNGQDDLIWYTANRTGNTYTIEVKTSNHKNDSGKYHTDIYAYDSEGKVSKVELTATVPGANEAPVISNAKITNVSRSGYTVTCTVTDDNAVDRVLMPTWSENNGQDDLIWYTANRTGNTYTIEVDMMNHNYDTGKINTDIYAYDDEGEYSKLELDTKIEENQAPVISDVKVINVTSDEYTVICKVTDDLEVVRVQMPTWTVNNGQDDIVWHEAELKNGVATFTVNRKDHNFEYGDYITHIYAYDREGLKGFSICGTVNLKEPDINTSTKPIIKNVKISNINDSGYTVTCTVLSNNKITEVLFPTWTYKNEQDDLIWGVGQKLENEYTFRVNRSDHNYEFGTYVTHIYAYDEKGAVNNIELPFHNIINTTERIGWAYIDGQKYFFDNKGNIAGNMPSKKVIDVSSYNGNIDWNTVKQYGDVDGAILRIAAHPNGEYIEDVQFANNLAACRRLKIPFGVYIYDYSNSENDALNEAKFVIDILQKYNVTPDELGYPVYFDLERTTITKEQNIANMNAFISEMNAKGYTTNVYSYRAMLNSSLNDKAILSNVSWMAAYTDTIGWENPYYKGKFGWQYTSSGSIPGISGNVDISCWYTI